MFLMLSSQIIKIKPVKLLSQYSIWQKTLTIRQNIFYQIFEKSASIKISRYTVLYNLMIVA